MEIKEAYKKYQVKLQSTSIEYNKITMDGDGSTLAPLFFIKAYKDYIIYLSNNKTSPRLKSMGKLSTLEYKQLNTLLESLVILIDTFCLDIDKIFVKDNNIGDPLEIVDVILKDFITSKLSEDDVYEDICKSLVNIIVEDNFEQILKGLFLKFAHSKSI